MEKATCPFGPHLFALRKSKNISQWQLAVLSQYNVTNLRKIEKGLTQPGIMLAMRLVALTGADVALFFEDLARAVVPPSPPEKEGVAASKGTSLSDDFSGIFSSQVRCLFGPFFKMVRLQRQISQKIVSDAAGCDLRNMLNVESGQQEPGIMTALSMVIALGVNVGDFF